MFLSLLCRFDPHYTHQHLRPAVKGEPSPDEQSRHIENFLKKPLISIVMTTYNSDLDYLERAVSSVLRQSYPRWELCIVDDASPDSNVQTYLMGLSARDKRCKVHLRAENGHMSRASNDAVELASGEFIALLDHDDELAPTALYWVVEALQRYPSAKLLYTDEDKIDAFGYRFLPSLKPRWSPDFCLSQNYVCHLGVYETERVRSIGGFRPGFEGSQDHDLLLRFVEGLPDSQIVHIPRVLYHWRTLPTSTAGNGVANKPYALINGQRAVQQAVAREAGDCAITEAPNWGYRTRWRPQPQRAGQIHVVLHSAATLQLAEQSAEDLHLTNEMSALHLHLLTSPFDGPAKSSVLVAGCTKGGVHGESIASPAMLAAYVNGLAARAPEATIVLIRAGLVPSDSNWLAQLTGQAERDGIGFATSKVVDAKGRIVHSGWFVDTAKIARPEAAQVPSASLREFGRYQVTYNTDGADRTLLAVKAKNLLLVEGLPEIENAILADVTCSLRLRAIGLRHVVDAWMSFQALASQDGDLGPEPQDLCSWEPAHAAWLAQADGQHYRYNNYLMNAARQE